MLIAGGISLFLGLKIYSIHKRTEQGFTHTLAAGGIYDTLHLIVSEVQYIQATGMFDRFDRLPNLRRTLTEKIRTYRDSHLTGGANTFAAVESLLVERLRQIEADLGILLDQVEKNFGSRVYLQPGDMVRLRDVLDRGMENSKNLHNFHQAAVLDLSRQGQRLIRLVVWLYMLFVAIGILLVVAASLMLRGKVAIPLGELAGAALRIAEGRLDQRVVVASRDEIGKLSHAFNVMADRLQGRERDLHAAQVRLERKVWELDILHRIGTDLLAFNGVEGPDAILRSVVNHTREIMNVEAAAICLFIPGREEVEVRSTSGPADAFRVRGGVVGCSAACLENQEHRPTDCPVMRSEYLRSHLPLPLNRGGESVGVLCVASREERIFSSEEKDTAHLHGRAGRHRGRAWPAGRRGATACGAGRARPHRPRHARRVSPVGEPPAPENPTGTGADPPGRVFSARACAGGNGESQRECLRRGPPIHPRATHHGFWQPGVRPNPDRVSSRV